MEVVKGQETQWKALAEELNVRYKKRAEIILRTDHNDIQKMEAVVDHYVRYYPTRSWDYVASALRGTELHQQGDIVIAKYVRGILMMISGSIVNT